MLRPLLSAVAQQQHVIIACLNILIIKLGALGDVVMATPLVAAIQQAHSIDDVHLLTSTPFDSIFAGWPSLHVTVHPRRGIINTLHTLRWIRGLKPSRIYDLQGNDRTALLCALSGSAMRVGNHPRFPYTHHPRTRWSGQCHIFERMIEVLNAAEIEEIGTTPKLPIQDSEREEISEWLIEHELEERKFVILHAQASMARPEKKWPYFESLGQRLSERGLLPVWIGGRDAARENQRLCSAAGGIDATAAFSLPGLAEVARQARFAVTNDSGPMHVLAAASIPVFGLFGPSDWRRNHALGQRERVIACVECLDEFRGVKTAHCLDRISCDMVLQRIEASGVL